MGNKFRKKVSFQLQDIPNKLKRQAKEAGETWTRTGGFCAGCKTQGTPAIIGLQKDEKDHSRYFFMLCKTCVAGADKAAEEAQRQAANAPLKEMLVRARHDKSMFRQLVDQAHEHMREGKEELDKQKAEEE